MQVPAHFEYEKATSVDHAIALLTRWGDEALVVAGGHSLIPMMKLRLARPEALIDINDLTELSYIRLAGDEIQIGAMTRHTELLESRSSRALSDLPGRRAGHRRSDRATGARWVDHCARRIRPKTCRRHSRPSTRPR